MVKDSFWPPLAMIPSEPFLKPACLQDGDRLLRVVGVVVAVRRRLRRVHPGGERRGDDPGLVGGRLVAVLTDRGGLLPVDRVRHRLPHRDVLQDRVRQVDEHAHVRDRREPVVVVRALGQVELLDVRDELAAPLRLAVGQVGVGRVVGEERRVVDRADLRQARLPVVRVGRVLDVLRGAGAAARREGAGADRVLVGVGHRVRDLRPDLLVHDPDLVGDVVEVRHRDGLELS